MREGYITRVAGCCASDHQLINQSPSQLVGSVGVLRHADLQAVPPPAPVAQASCVFTSSTPSTVPAALRSVVQAVPQAPAAAQQAIWQLHPFIITLFWSHVCRIDQGHKHLHAGVSRKPAVRAASSGSVCFGASYKKNVKRWMRLLHWSWARNEIVCEVNHTSKLLRPPWHWSQTR